MSLAYALHQYQLAASSSGRTASSRFDRWAETAAGMLTGKLSIGSRVPVRGIAAFLTLDVLKGGFASGRLAAGGPLLQFEIKLLERHNLPTLTDADSPNRTELNKFFLSTDGFKLLNTLLESGRYKVSFPEEGALLAVAWMLERGDVTQATEVVTAILPYFKDVRFYPQPASSPVSVELKCSRYNIGECRELLLELRPNNRELAYPINKLVVEDLGPAYDALVALVLSTCNDNDSLLPFQKPPSPAMKDEFSKLNETFERIQSTVVQYREAHPRYGNNGADPAKTLGQLRPTSNCGAILEASRTFFLGDPSTLTGRQVCFIENILCHIRDKSLRSLPRPWSASLACDSPQLSSSQVPEKLARYRALQQGLVRRDAKTMSSSWVNLVLRRIGAITDDEHVGLDDVSAILMRTTATEEAESLGSISEGSEIPDRIARVVKRLRSGTISELVGRGFVPSMEVLGSLVDQVIGAAKVQGSTDMEMQRLYSAVGAAFRRRQSLLLLYYASQVRFEELPWVHRLDEVRAQEMEKSDAAQALRSLLVQLITLCVRRWPHVIIPNKMVSAIDQIARAASASLCGTPWINLLPELAADIFMDGFTYKWCRHAAVAEKDPGKKLYAEYYSIADHDAWHKMTVADEESEDAKKSQVELFADLCRSMRNCRRTRDYYSIARNGQVIEASMVLTGHNYPYLFVVLRELGKEFSSDEILALSLTCFSSLNYRMKAALDSSDSYSVRLRETKNVAYGWRQLVYLVSQLDGEYAERFFASVLSWEQALNGFQLQRALIDLYSVWKRVSSESGLRNDRFWQPFYGWVHGPHPIWDRNWTDGVDESVARVP